MSKRLRTALVAALALFMASGALVCQSQQRYYIEREQLRRQIETLDNILGKLVAEGRITPDQAAEMRRKALAIYKPKDERR